MTNLCNDVTALKDFLRLSRHIVDDTITQNINNLVLPTKFEPSSTKSRVPVDKIDCNELIHSVRQNWDVRANIIKSCMINTEPTIPHQPTEDEIRARRLDPYSNRHHEEDTILQRTCRQELATEEIIKERTWKVIRARCPST